MKKHVLRDLYSLNCFLLLAMVFMLCVSPVRAVELSQIRIYSDSATPAAERLDLLLTLLEEEVRSPVDPQTGWGGGSIDHDYTMAQIALAISHVARETEPVKAQLRQAADSTSSPEVRDAMLIALGLCGDVSVAEDLTVILKSSTSPSRRALSASALGACNAMLFIPDLAEALNDSAKMPRASDVGQEDRNDFPVRRAASLALRHLGVTVTNPDPVREFEYQVDSASAVKAIEPLLNSSENGISMQAIHAIRRIGDETARSTLRSFAVEIQDDMSKEDLVEAANAALADISE